MDRGLYKLNGVFLFLFFFKSQLSESILNLEKKTGITSYEFGGFKRPNNDNYSVEGVDYGYVLILVFQLSPECGTPHKRLS